MIEDVWNELNEGEIHARDSHQFELKSEFFINPHLKQNVYKQEVYLFIPNPLQIHRDTYSKQQFYLDQTNLIRYKTPAMTFADLINSDYSLSPLTRLAHLLNRSDFSLFIAKISDELKLFAAIFRSTLSEQVYSLVRHIEAREGGEKIAHSIVELCTEIAQTCHLFRQLPKEGQELDSLSQLNRHFRYVDEFISMAIEEFLVILLHYYRSLPGYDRQVDKVVMQTIIQEKFYREEHQLRPKMCKGDPLTDEAVLYRHGLLHRFVLEALMLKNFRFSPEEKHRTISSAIAAGIAMMVYSTLFFFWTGSKFVIDSLPFVVLVVFLYILKDRIKEAFKDFYAKQVHRWLPDYSTEIRNFKGFKVGTLTESFAFIDEMQLPPGFLKIRTHHFQEELQTLQRHETIIQYKRELTLHLPLNYREERRRELTTIFRLNIHRFLQKASNPFQPNLILDTYTQEISEKLVPKIYHLNLIIRNSFLQADLTPHVEIKTYRVVVDKNGIKRVESIQLSSL